MLVIIYALNKFRHYITGYQIFIHNDHAVIRYLMNKSVISCRLARWLLLMQQFEFLSRIQRPNDLAAIEDVFPNEHLFAIKAI